MISEGAGSPHDWQYAHSRSLRGALQRGRGIAVARLRDRPEDAELVYECTSRDTRWDDGLDNRCTYLARLIRDLRLDPAPLVAQLRACGPYPGLRPDPTNDGNRFDLAVGDAAVRARSPAHRTGLVTASDAQLLTLLQNTSTDLGALNLILGRLRHLGRPMPEILDLVDRLAPACPAGLFGLLRELGGRAATLSYRDARQLLAALDRFTDDWCGYDMLTEGLARSLADLPPTAHAYIRSTVVRRLRWLTNASPHTYERAGYLRSLLLLDPQHTTARLPIQLLDCEPQVRLLAAQHTPLTDDALRWLTELRDDPIEEVEIRTTAAARLAADEDGGSPIKI
jgi:hypothetical protein